MKGSLTPALRCSLQLRGGGAVEAEGDQRSSSLAEAHTPAPWLPGMGCVAVQVRTSRQVTRKPHRMLLQHLNDLITSLT